MDSDHAMYYIQETFCLTFKLQLNTCNDHAVNVWTESRPLPYFFWAVTRPGPNIPLILPIIQELYSPISTPLFKRKLPIILKEADKKLAVSGMTQCDCPTDHGIHLPIQFKLLLF